MSHEGFRANEINFLQEQNNIILAQLERVEAERDESRAQIKACEERDSALQGEVQGVRDRIARLGDRLQQNGSETIAKDEHVRVLSEQNSHMLNLLETEETRARENAEQIKALEAKNSRLQAIAAEFDVVKEQLEKKVAEAKVKYSDTLANVRGQRSLNETLRANIQNTEAKTRVDMEALGQALEVVERKNLEYMQRINKQETKEQQLQGETASLKEDVEKLRADIDQLRNELQGDEEGRSHFARARGPLEAAIEALEIQVDTLKKALGTAERANEQLSEENRGSAERCRETADKVYALMDSLRLNQLELKKQEAENAARDKKLLSLERQSQNLQAKISMESDAKVLAEQERREAEQEAIILKKKNRKVEEAITQSQQGQEKAEKEIAHVGEKVNQLQTQNAYLTSRIDGQEEEKSAVKLEIKKLADQSGSLGSENSRLRDEMERLEEEIATAQREAQQLQKELEYIKREDVLDEAGRQRPVLIQSTESDLMEKLQLNEYLYEAQQARNPVPPLIEKIAQLLAMLHEGQSRADQYLADLSKSNGLVSALRQRNVQLFGRTQVFESFKTRALLRYVMNLIESPSGLNVLNLDGLNFGPRELNELLALLQRYEAQEELTTLSLQENGLDAESVNLLLQLIFATPYLKSLDLRRNCLDEQSGKRMEEQLRMMEGVTGVVRSNGGNLLNVHSGNQLRLSIDLSDQLPKDLSAKDVDFSVQQELSHEDADPFLPPPSSAQHPLAGSQGGAGQQQHLRSMGNNPNAAGGYYNGNNAGGAGGQQQQPWNKTPAVSAAMQQSSQKGFTTRGLGLEVGSSDAAGGKPPGVSPRQVQAQLQQGAGPLTAAGGGPPLGGPPVGLGGPGNVANLSRKAGRQPGGASGGGAGRAMDPKRRQGKRAKAAPPAPLPRSGSCKPSQERGQRSDYIPAETQRALSLDRSCSLPMLPMAPGAKPRRSCLA